MRRNSQGIAGTSNPSFNTYSHADAHFDLNETLNGNTGTKQQPIDMVAGEADYNQILIKELEECHTVVQAKDQQIQQLQQTIEIMKEKMQKMDELLAIKDRKIENLRNGGQVSFQHSFQYNEGQASQEGASEVQRRGGNAALISRLSTPDNSQLVGPPRHDQQHFQHVSGLSISQISKNGVSYGYQANQGGPGLPPPGALNTVP